MFNTQNITQTNASVSSTGNGLPYWHSTPADRAASPEGNRRRQQLVALLYAHGGGMALAELLSHPDSPPTVEAILCRNPDWFAVGRFNVRLAWVNARAVKTARARRRAGGGS